MEELDRPRGAHVERVGARMVHIHQLEPLGQLLVGGEVMLLDELVEEVLAVEHGL